MEEQIFTLIYSIVELTDYLLAYTIFWGFKIKTKWYTLGAVYLGVVLVNVLNILSGSVILYDLVTLSYALIVPLIIFKEKKLKGVLLFPSVFMFTSIINVCGTYICVAFTEISANEVIINMKYTVLAELSFIVFVIGYKLYCKMKKEKETALQLTAVQNIMLTIILVFILIILSAIQYIGMGEMFTAKMEDGVGMAVSVACVAFFITIYSLLKSIKKNDIYAEEKRMISLYMGEQEKYVKMILYKDENMRKFRHDMSAHMVLLNNYMQNKRYEEAGEYIAKINGVIAENVPKYTGIVAIDAVIDDRKRYMEEKNIELKWQGKIGIEIINKIEVYDLCTLFINIINNAIEACETLKDNRVINMQVKTDEGRLYISETNYTYSKIQFDKEGNPVTIKEDTKNHNIRSKNIREEVGKYRGMIKYKVENSIFIIEIIV